ncbi:MAG: WcaF family extracellular polysaccharide biosynthesis acetyltransferase [Xanthomonadales bacterium]|nr:WcaF family extracellular polysaccharide biosynthesis acetyltransferase [Xanthomonadales bacterium]
MRLDRFDNKAFDRGRPRWVELLWRMAGDLLVDSWLPGSRWRCWVLRRFGARIGRGVVIKPRVRVKFPWRLTTGDHCWIGESVWIDNLAEVEIGDHCCISQGAYLCTGSHDWSRESFDLRVGRIVIEQGSWVGAFARIGPGVTVGAGAVACLGAVVVDDLEACTVWAGNPARKTGTRRLSSG